MLEKVLVTRRLVAILFAALAVPVITQDPVSAKPQSGEGGWVSA
jgi:hypothetical protein